MSTPRDFRTNTDNKNYNSEILGFFGRLEQGRKETRDVTRAVREMMNYTLPAKEFSVFSQIAE